MGTDIKILRKVSKTSSLMNLSENNQRLAFLMKKDTYCFPIPNNLFQTLSKYEKKINVYKKISCFT